MGIQIFHCMRLLMVWFLKVSITIRMAALWFSISFISYVSFIKFFPNGPPYRLKDAYHLFFGGVEVLCIFYSVHIVYTIVKSICKIKWLLFPAE